jgi:hypothetical protein
MMADVHLESSLIIYGQTQRNMNQYLNQYTIYNLYQSHSRTTGQSDRFDRQVAYALRSCFLGALRLLGTEETPPMGAMPDAWLRIP